MIVSLVSSLRAAIVLLVADVVGILGLFSLAHFLRIGQAMPSDLMSLVWIATVFLLTMYVLDIYRGVLRESSLRLIIRTTLAIVVASGVVTTLAYVIKPVETNA